MTGLAIIAAAVVAIAAMVLFIGVGRLIEPQESVRTRIDALFATRESATSQNASLAAASEGGGGERRLSARTLQPFLQVMNRIVSQRSFSASIATDLARANVLLTVPEYVLLTLTTGLVLFALVFLLARQVLFAIAAGLGGLALPRLYVRRQQAKRLIAFQDQLPDVLTMLVGSLRAGYGITVAMDMVAKQMPPPASDEFNRVVREIGLGATTTQALANLVRRVRSDDLDLVVTAIAIQYDVGGNLAIILETISGTIRERIRLKGQLRVLTAQTSMQRMILTLLPVVLALVIYLVQPEYIMALFAPGPWVLIPAFAAVMVVLGYMVMAKMSQVEF